MTKEDLPSGQPKRGDPEWRHAGAVLVRWMAWLYLSGALGAWALLRLAGDRWWPATLLLFGPRWALLAPALPVLASAALLRRRGIRPALVSATAAIVVAGPVMGLCVSWRTTPSAASSAARVRIVTCNIHGTALNSAAFGRLLAESDPDLVVLQEAPVGLAIELPARGVWHVRSDGELFLASRYPIVTVQGLGGAGWPGGGDAVHYELRTPVGSLHLFNVHLDSPHQQLEAILDLEPGAASLFRQNIADRWQQSQRIGAAARLASGPVLIAGDLNTPAGSAIFPAIWSGFTDAFSAAGAGYGYTYFSRRAAVRIDHVLSNNSLRCLRCWMGPEVGSPHRPLIADVECGLP